MRTHKNLALFSLLVLAPYVMILAVAVTFGGAGISDAARVAASTNCVIPVRPGIAERNVTLTESQISNARVIYLAGVGLGVPARGEVIALATALQESDLQNLSSGDRDSVGLFQQRPSQGWGSAEQLLNPVYAATQFYRHLLAIDGWERLSIDQAAQAVQQSGTPDAYGKWEPLATRLVAGFASNGGNCLTDDGDGGLDSGGGGQYHPPPGMSREIATVISFALAQLGKPYRWGASGPDAWDCSGLTQAAYARIGVRLGRTTYAQVTEGRPIYNLSDLQPGDLLFTAGSDGTPSMPGHVGLYLGNATVLHAPHTGTVVKLSPLSQWQRQIVAIRRMVE